LNLLNYRNYERVDLNLRSGVILIEGANGQGKSNLLEALYTLAIGKSSRASTEREVVRHQLSQEETFTQIVADVERDSGHLRIQVDFKIDSTDRNSSSSAATGSDSPEISRVQKWIRVNGLPRRSSDLIGEINAVMFSAQDLELVIGPPSERRRYLDILISQIDRNYLTSLQRYQKILVQRNHLLKSLRDGRSQVQELDFWSDSLVRSGMYIMSRRSETVSVLSQIAKNIHHELTGSEDLDIIYVPSAGHSAVSTEEEFGELLNAAMAVQRSKEIAQGFTTVGPHRDDMQVLLQGTDAGTYGSRGQCRTAVLTMRLAEASYLEDLRKQEPIILLDDVLSELDPTRRSLILDRASKYQQCFITTADIASIDETFTAEATRFIVMEGQLRQVGNI